MTKHPGVKRLSMAVTERHDWSRLNRLQLGRYAEYLAKMEFVLWGCDVYTAEVDDRGIDFVIRTRRGHHYDIQVKSFRLTKGKSTPYVFIQKKKFVPHAALLLVLVQFVSGSPPILYLVRSKVGVRRNPIFESRDYGKGRKSLPEWGLTMSKKKIGLLCEHCSFAAVLRELD